METAKLSTNIKQNYAKQCTCQQKELGHLGGRLIWSLSDYILLYLFILNKLLCILKKPEWKQCRASNHIPHFPTAVAFFQQETSWNLHFPRSLTLMCWLLGKDEKTNSHSYDINLTGPSLKWVWLQYGSLASAAKFKASQRAHAMNSSCPRWEQPGTQEE